MTSPADTIREDMDELKLRLNRLYAGANTMALHRKIVAALTELEQQLAAADARADALADEYHREYVLASTHTVVVADRDRLDKIVDEKIDTIGKLVMREERLADTLREIAQGMEGLVLDARQTLPLLELARAALATPDTPPTGDDRERQEGESSPLEHRPRPDTAPRVRVVALQEGDAGSASVIAAPDTPPPTSYEFDGEGRAYARYANGEVLPTGYTARSFAGKSDVTPERFREIAAPDTPPDA